MVRNTFGFAAMMAVIVFALAAPGYCGLEWLIKDSPNYSQAINNAYYVSLGWGLGLWKYYRETN